MDDIHTHTNSLDKQRIQILALKLGVWSWRGGAYKGLLGMTPPLSLEGQKVKNFKGRQTIELSVSILALSLGFKVHYLTSSIPTSKDTNTQQCIRGRIIGKGKG